MSPSPTVLHVNPAAGAALPSLHAARDAIRKDGGKSAGGYVVEIASGRYAFAEPLELTEDDCGTADAPIIYRAAKDAAVHLCGGVQLTQFTLVSDDAVLKRLSPEARGKVVQCDLRAAGVTDFGEVAAIGKRPELFIDGKAMTLARWPNEGFTTVADITDATPITVHGFKGSSTGKFHYTGDRPARWLAEPDAWLHGYWFWDWSDAYQQIESIDVDSKLISTKPPYHNYGYRKDQRFYALNLLCELDTPGEFYIDRDRGLLYLWPPGDLAQSEVVLSNLRSLITMVDVAHTRFEGLTLDSTRDSAITIEGGEAITVDRCLIHNTGSYAVHILGGKNHTVSGCDITSVGAGGVHAMSGDRTTLTPCGHVVRNCHIWNFARVARTYRPAIGMHGVGVTAENNLIHDGPHCAILLSGNDHVIRQNELHSVCYETGDVGAFYMGRDWTARGTVISENYFHHIKGPGKWGANTVYLDDAASGITIRGNLFIDTTHAAFIGGGRDNLVEHNVFIDCNAAVHVDARGLNWMKYHVEGENAVLPQRFHAVAATSEVWRAKYPHLADILTDEPGAPKYNIIRENVSVGGTWTHIEEAARPYLTIQDNLVDKDPHFNDAAGGDYTLKPESPAFEMGFEQHAYDKAGLYNDPAQPRFSWPVTHEVRQDE